MMNNNNPRESTLLQLHDIQYVEITKYLHPHEILNLLLALAKHPDKQNLLLIKKIIHECTVFLRPGFNMAEYFINSQYVSFLPFKNLTQKQHLQIAKAAIQNPNEFCTFLQSTHPIEEKNQLIEYISYVLHRMNIESEVFISTVFFHPHIKPSQFPKLYLELARFFIDEQPHIRWQFCDEHPSIAIEHKLDLFHHLLLESGSYTQRLNLIFTFLQSDENFEIKHRVFQKFLNHYSFSMSRAFIDAICNLYNGLTRHQRETLIIEALQQPILNPVWVHAITQMQLSFNPTHINPLFDYYAHILHLMNYQELNLPENNPYCSFSLDWPNEQEIQYYIGQLHVEADSLLKLTTFYRLTVFLEQTWEEEYDQYQSPDIELLELGDELIQSESEVHQGIMNQLTTIMISLTEDRLRTCGDHIETGLIYRHWFPAKTEDFLFKASRMISAIDTTPFESVEIMRCMLNTSHQLAIPYGKLHAEDFQHMIYSSEFIPPPVALLQSYNQYFGTEVTWENQIHAIECLLKIEGIHEKLLKHAIKFIPYLFPFPQINQNMLLDAMMAFAEMLNIDIDTFSQLHHQLKRICLLEHLVADPRFQIEDSIATIQCYLPLLKNPHIDFEFKLCLIPYLYDKAPNHDPRTNDIRVELVETSIHLLRHTKMNPLKIHALYNHHTINAQIALVILNVYDRIDIRFLIQLGHIYHLPACLAPQHHQFKELLLQQLFIKIGIHRCQPHIAVEAAEKLLALAPLEGMMIGDRLIYLLNNTLRPLNTNEKMMIGTFLLSHNLEIPAVLAHFENEPLNNSEAAIVFSNLLNQHKDTAAVFKRQRL
jgi:hypothetical protein